MQYEYFGTLGERRTSIMTDDYAAKVIGSRVLCGFPVVSRTVETPDDRCVTVTYFQSDVSGKVWALYYDDEPF